MNTNVLKAIMLSAALSGAVITPMPVIAATTYLMFVNTRGSDGIYYPALRIVRGGTVTYYSTQGTNLTPAILADRDALNAWLAQNAGITADEASAAIVEVVKSSRKSGDTLHPCPPEYPYLIKLPGGGAWCSSSPRD